VRVRAREDPDVPLVERFLRDESSLRVARLGRLERPLEHPALVAVDEDGKLAGVLTYVDGEGEGEILTLHATRQWAGAGTALVEGLKRHAAGRGWRRIWVLTTNDNIDGLRFYQRRGFRLAQLNAGAVDDARATLKPEIPREGSYGIPLRDELILELPL
jgi:GNAT superfamily N-acetyltransferase